MPKVTLSKPPSVKPPKVIQPTVPPATIPPLVKPPKQPKPPAMQALFGQKRMRPTVSNVPTRTSAL